MKARDILCCWDIWTSLIISIVISLIMPDYIDLEFVKDLYGIAISILSIIFSLYFAALAIIITSGDDSFIIFLENDDIYTGVINTFKFTLILTFFSLILAICLYFSSSFFLSLECEQQSIFVLGGFSFFFLYSLFAVYNATLDAIRYAKKRIEFLELKD